MTDAELYAFLQRLFVHARHDGADPNWLAQGADVVFARMLGLPLSAKRRRTLAQADRLARHHRAMLAQGYRPGAAVAALCACYGLRRSWVYESLKMSGRHTGRKSC